MQLCAKVAKMLNTIGEHEEVLLITQSRFTKNLQLEQDSPFLSSLARQEQIASDALARINIPHEKPDIDGEPNAKRTVS
ncbi:MAG: hypothetical protein KR126chlam1_00236 [Chlamydiae bacterium]|nr:hypothetical protein [Chlamydiota bacterium]